MDCGLRNTEQFKYLAFHDDDEIILSKKVEQYFSKWKHLSLGQTIHLSNGLARQLCEYTELDFDDFKESKVFLSFLGPLIPG